MFLFIIVTVNCKLLYIDWFNVFLHNGTVKNGIPLTLFEGLAVSPPPLFTSNCWGLSFSGPGRWESSERWSDSVSRVVWYDGTVMKGQKVFTNPNFPLLSSIFFFLSRIHKLPVLFFVTCHCDNHLTLKKGKTTFHVFRTYLDTYCAVIMCFWFYLTYLWLTITTFLLQSLYFFYLSKAFSAVFSLYLFDIWHKWKQSWHSVVLEKRQQLYIQ